MHGNYCCCSYFSVYHAVEIQSKVIFRVLLKLNVHVIKDKPICCWIKALVWMLLNLTRGIMKLLYLQLTCM